MTSIKLRTPVPTSKDFVIGQPVIRKGIRPAKSPLYYSTRGLKEGKSTGFAFYLLSQAILNPYCWIEIQDCENEEVSNTKLIMIEIIKKMSLQHIYFKTDSKQNKTFVSFGDPK